MARKFESVLGALRDAGTARLGAIEEACASNIAWLNSIVLTAKAQLAAAEPSATATKRSTRSRAAKDPPAVPRRGGRRGRNAAPSTSLTTVAEEESLPGGDVKHTPDASPFQRQASTTPGSSLRVQSVRRESESTHQTPANAAAVEQADARRETLAAPISKVSPAAAPAPAMPAEDEEASGAVAVGAERQAECAAPSQIMDSEGPCFKLSPGQVKQRQFRDLAPNGEVDGATPTFASPVSFSVPELEAPQLSKKYLQQPEVDCAPHPAEAYPQDEPTQEPASSEFAQPEEAEPAAGHLQGQATGNPSEAEAEEGNTPIAVMSSEGAQAALCSETSSGKEEPAAGHVQGRATGDPSEAEAEEGNMPIAVTSGEGARAALCSEASNGKEWHNALSTSQLSPAPEMEPTVVAADPPPAALAGNVAHAVVADDTREHDENAAPAAEEQGEPLECLAEHGQLQQRAMPAAQVEGLRVLAEQEQEQQAAAKPVGLAANLVSSVRSFLPSFTRCPGEVPAAGKKPVKVKALEAAEAARRKEEAKAVERARMKEDMEKRRLDNLKRAADAKARQEAELRANTEARRQRELQAAARREQEAQQKKDDEAKRRQEDDVAAALRQRRAAEEERKRKAAQKLPQEKTGAAKRPRLEGHASGVPYHSHQPAPAHRPCAVAVAPPQHAAVVKVKLMHGITDYSPGAAKRGAACTAAAAAAASSSLHPDSAQTATCPSSSQEGCWAPECQHGPAATGSSGPMQQQQTAYESYDISPYRDVEESESSEDEEPRKPVPEWARGRALAQHLESQLAVDPDEIFRQQAKTCSLDEVFGKRAEADEKGNGKRDLSRRTSSGNWIEDRVTWKEELSYKRAMGYL